MNDKTIRPIEDWTVTQLRTSAFYAPSDSIDSSDWWLDLLGTQPDQRLEQPREGIIRSIGIIEEGQLQLAISRGRSDLLMRPFESLENKSDLGSVPGGFTKFLELSKKLLTLDNFPKIHRLAFGSIVQLRVKSQTEGVEELSKYLHFKVPDKNASDFLYQINRPIQSKKFDAKIINSLAKWSVVTIQSTSFSTGPDGTTAKLGEPTVQTHCHLEMDINNMPTEGEYVDPEILEEFRDRAIQLCGQGDVE